MNYFELFDIPVQFRPPVTSLKARFFSLSREFHPDYHSQADESAQMEMLEKSSLLNKAWKTLQDPDETIRYVLQLKGLLEEEEKYTLPPAFLMEMLEINEQLAEAKMEGDETAIAKGKAAIHDLEKDIYEPVKAIVENYKEGFTTQEEMLRVKEYYYKKKYLKRILEGLG